jgi:hypothetical protein
MPRQTEWARRHVLDQTLDARLIACCQKYWLIDTETANRATHEGRFDG